MDVRWQHARTWLDSVRYASLRIEPLLREIGAMQDAYDEMLPWASRGSGAGATGTHSDPTAAQAYARAESYSRAMAAKLDRLDALYATVDACGEVLTRLADAMGDDHSLALELYYIDCAETWTDVADELGVSRTTLWQIRDESYGWIECHCRADLQF